MVKEMRSFMRVVIALLFLFQGSVGASITFTPLLAMRWRQERFDTLSANPALDPHYSYGNWRGRFGGDLHYRFMTLHGLGQAAGSYHLPGNASFGAGASYFTASNRESAPSHVDPIELSLNLRPQKSTFVNIGRQGIKEGAEPPTGDARLDWVKENRVSERLIGTWDWTNVGRRFEGLTAGYSAETWTLSGFGARILQGGFNYPDAFKPLDDVKTFGLSSTVKRDVWIPHTEVRFFDVVYRDARPVTATALGKRLSINTAGVQLVGTYAYGPGVFDALLWGAYQSGNYGTKHQSAEALIFETGYGWPQSAWAHWLRAGVNYASGDSRPSDSTHRTFFNLAPTNHKFYGMQDLNAFQNLTDIFAQWMVQPVKPLKAALEGHLFRLSRTADAWYVGSGPANNTAFGITSRRPATGSLTPAIGSEIDLTLTGTFFKRWVLQGGYSHFEGASAARTLYPVKRVTNFMYMQVVFTY